MALTSSYMISPRRRSHLKTLISIPRQVSLTFISPLINDQALKDSPFKLISCTIGRLQLNNPSFNLLNSKINIEVHNIDIILMPVMKKNGGPLMERRDSSTSSNGSGGSSDEAESQEEQKQGDNKKGSSSSDKTEEFNILNNLVNKLLSNLEVKVSTITVRVLTNEMKPELDEDIPTLLLRVNQIEYRKNQQPIDKQSKMSQVPSKQNSDIQAILDNKILDVSEISVHFMKATHLYPDEFIRGKKTQPQLIQQTLPKLHFPQEYPLTSHPNTILLIKSPSSPDHVNKCLTITFNFAKPKSIQDNPPNLLNVSFSLPQIESIIQFNQLKDILIFSQSISQLSEKQPELEMSGGNNDQYFDIYGELVRNNQKFKELPPQQLKKAKSNETKNTMASKMNLQKDKLIFKFLKNQSKKHEIQKLKDELKKSIALNQSLVDSGVSFSQPSENVDQSMFMMQMSQVYQQNPATQNVPLSVNVEASIHKIAISLLANESSVAYDNVYEANFTEEELKQSDSVKESRFGYTHYSFKLAELSAILTMNHLKKQTANQQKQQPVTPLDKLISFKAKLHSLDLTRHDLFEAPHPSFKQPMDQLQGTVIDPSQYESFASSSMFRSAHEFYVLHESKIQIGQSIVSTSSNNTGSAQKQQRQKQGQAPLESSQMSPEVQQMIYHPPLLNPYMLNPYFNHFTQTKIITLQPIKETIFKQHQQQLQLPHILSLPGVFEVYLQTTIEEGNKKLNKLSTRAYMKVGTVDIKPSLTDILMILSLTRGIVNEKEQQLQAQAGNSVMESFRFQVEEIRLGLDSAQIVNMNVLGAMIENKPIDQLFTLLSANYLELQAQPNELLTLSLSNIKITKLLKDPHLNLSISQIEILLQQTKILTLETINIELKPNMAKQMQQKSPEPQQQQPFVIYEGQDKGIQQQQQQLSPDLTQSQISKGGQTQSNIASIPRQTVKVTIKVQHFHLGIDLSKALIPEYFTGLQKLDGYMKFIMIATDIIKCFNNNLLQKQEIDILKQDDQAYSGLKVPINPFIEEMSAKNRVKAQPTNFELDLQIQNLQCYAIEDGVMLMKIRLLEPQMNMKYVPPGNQQVLGTTKKERIQIQFKIIDVLVIDYFQVQPILIHEQANMMQGQQAYFDTNGNLVKTKFEDDLLQNENQVILYRQQHFREIQPLRPAIEVKLDIMFKLEQEPFEQRVSVDMLASIFILHTQLKSLYEEVLLMKKNPMIMRINLNTHGLVLGLSVINQTELIKHFLSISKQFDSLFQVEKPLIEEQIPQLSLNKDKMEFILNMEETSLDYRPSLIKDIYDKIYLKDFESLSISLLNKDSEPPKRSAEKPSLLFKTPYRVLISIGNLSLTLQKFCSEHKIVNNLSLKCSDLGIKILQLPDLSDVDHDPILLLDINSPLQSAKGLLDQLGFVQLLYIDVIELRKTETTSQQQNDQSFAPRQSYMQQQEEEKVSQEQQQEDLFATSYGQYQQQTETISENQKCEIVKQTVLVLVTNKISLQFSKDSFQALNQIVQILINQIHNIVSQAKVGEKPKEPKQKYDESVIEEQDEGEDLDKLLNEFLITDFDSSIDMQQQQQIPEISRQSTKTTSSTQGIYLIDEENENYFTVNTGLHVNRRNEIDKVTYPENLVDMTQYVVDNYLPVLNESDLAANRHRFCHHLPDQLRAFQPINKFHIEIHSIDLKLYEGFDFDFIATKPQGGYGASILSDLARLMIKERNEVKTEIVDSQLNQSWQSQLYSSVSSQRQRDSIIMFNEEYMSSGASQKTLKQTENPLKKQYLQYIQYLRRPRIAGRGNYLNMKLCNIILTIHDFDKVKATTEDVHRYCVSIQSINIKESISRFGKMTRELLQVAPFQKQYDNQFELIIQKESLNAIQEEVAFNLKVQPFKLMLNQAVVKFLQMFFEISFSGGQHEQSTTPSAKYPLGQSNLESHFEELKEVYQKPSQFQRKLKRKKLMKQHKKEIIISQMIIHPTHAIFTYTSRQLNLVDLTSGNLIELLNILNINDLRINIQGYNLKQRLELETALKHVTKFYVKDLVKNQKISIARALGPIRSVINISGALYGLFRKPYKAYKNDQGVFRGIEEGAYNLYDVLTQEYQFLSQKLLDGVAKVTSIAKV